MNIKYFWRPFFIALVILFVGQNAAAFPPYINYQGKITDLSGNALNGTYSMEFVLYNTQTGGSPMWNEPQSVIVENGIYNVQLGIYNMLSAHFFDESSLYLEVKIFNGDTSQWETFTPRQELTPTAFAMKADNASTLQGKPASEFAASIHLHSAAHITSGVLSDARIPAGIARDSEIAWNNLSGIPAGFLDGTDDTGLTDEVDPTVDPAVKDGVSWNEIAFKPGGFADNVDNDSGGDITEVTAGRGLDGGGTYGSLILDVEVPLHLGGAGGGFDPTAPVIKGTNTGSGSGVRGEASSGSNYGILGGTGNGVIGVSATGVGVHGESVGDSSYGNLGDNANNGGVYGKHVPSGNDGRIGSPWEGVRGYSPTAGRGVLGVSESGEGVRGTSTSGIGVYGYSASGRAAFFSGGNDHSDLFLGGSVGRINTDPDNQNSNLILSSNNDVEIRLDNDGGENGIFRIASSSAYVFFVDEAGKATTRVLEITGGSDLSEQFEIRKNDTDKEPLPGMVVSIDPENPGDLMISNKPYDRRVAGIISGAGGVKPGMLMGQKGSEADGTNPVALTGRVYCWADASKDAIEPGDLLTTSDTPGHAMKVTSYARAHGATLGKAMSPLDRGKGLVLVLVSLQ